MNIIEVALSDIIPYENNPRDNAPAVDAVAASIREFGFKNPIIIDKDNVIVAGHTRALAAEKLGLEVVPCIRADDLTEEQVKAFRLADNKTAELAEWDFSKLEAELAELADIDMSEFGFESLQEPERSELDKEVTKSNPITIKICFDKKSDMQKIEQQLREYIDGIEGARVYVSGGIVGDADEVDNSIA